MLQCTPVEIDGAIALISLVQFEGEVTKDSLFAGIVYGLHFVHPFVIIEIFISSCILNH